MRDRSVVDSKGRSEWQELITEWVHSEEDRRMLVRYLLDGLTVEAVAEEFNLSTVWAQARISKAKKQLFKHV